MQVYIVHKMCSYNSLELADGWVQWIQNFTCVLEHTWASADLQLQLSVYLLTGVVILWLLIGIAWWTYGEAISDLFELRSMYCGTMHSHI